MIRCNILEFYEKVLGLIGDWHVTFVERDDEHKEMHVHVEYKNQYGFHHCPTCGELSKLHDHRVRLIRHLDTCEYKTFIDVHLPRVECPVHGFQQAKVPFTEGNSHYTKAFENHVIRMLQNGTPVLTAANNLELSWGAIDGIKRRAVARGEERRVKISVKHIGIDETSFSGNNYITVILDKDNDRVIAVLNGRTSEIVLNWFNTQNIVDLSTVESISMDMSDTFIKGVREYFKNYEALVCIDRFHVSQLFNKALNKVRRSEYNEIEEKSKKSSAGKNSRKKKTKKNPLARMRAQILRNSKRTDNRNSKRKAFLSYYSQPAQVGDFFLSYRYHGG
jgi:transposase